MVQFENVQIAECNNFFKNLQIDLNHKT